MLNRVFNLPKRTFIIVVVVLAVIILFCGYKVIGYISNTISEKNEQQELITAIITPSIPVEIAGIPISTQNQSLENIISTPTQESWTVQDQYGVLFEQNPDMIGWIKIDGTDVDYPVMQTVDDPQYYLNHNFDKEWRDYGTPFADANCDISDPSDNIVIYGHHMKNGSMFSSLDKFKKQEFWQEHQTFAFDTIEGFNEYRIIAVFKVNPADFEYHHFINATDESVFDAYINRCKSLAYYDTGVSAAFGDKLVTLSTCEYSTEGNRLVVVAKHISDKP